MQPLDHQQFSQHSPLTGINVEADTTSPPPILMGRPSDIVVGKHTTILRYDDVVPAFAGPAIDRVQGHLLSSLRHGDVARSAVGASTYVVHQGDRIVMLLLFRRQGRTVQMITEFIVLDDACARQFAAYVFAAFPHVSVIRFNKVHVALQSPGYPWQQVTCSEDVVVPLPATVSEYEARLGKNMRRNIKRYTAELQRDFPDYRYQVWVGGDANEADVRAIIALNHTRMAGKNIVSRIDAREADWIVNLVRECGLVGVVTIDGRVAGGAIGFRIGERYFMHVIAHDPRYDHYSLGILCYYLTICEGIIRGACAFHLLPGRYEYKYRLLGQTHDVARVDLYRSRAHLLLHASRAARNRLASGLYGARLWLLESERRQDWLSRQGARLLRLLRRLRRRRHC